MNELDYAVMQGKNLLFHREAKNEPQDILAFVDELKLLPKFTISKSVFCMEQTDFYCNHLLDTLKRIKANVVVENALQIKNSLGLLRCVL
jgi:transposase